MPDTSSPAETHSGRAHRDLGRVSRHPSAPTDTEPHDSMPFDHQA